MSRAPQQKQQEQQERTLEEQIASLQLVRQRQDDFNMWLAYINEGLQHDNHHMFFEIQRLNFELGRRIANFSEVTQTRVTGYKRLETENAQQKSTIAALAQKNAELEEKITALTYQNQLIFAQNRSLIQKNTELHIQITELSQKPVDLTEIRTPERIRQWLDALDTTSVSEKAATQPKSTDSSSNRSRLFVVRTQPTQPSQLMSANKGPGRAKL